MTNSIKTQVEKAIDEFFNQVHMSVDEIFVIGCSTSEVGGELIGTSGSFEIAQAIFSGMWPLINNRGVYMAVQCCEHLNRALVIEKAAAEKYKYEPVMAKPHQKAGGTLATYAYEAFHAPVVVEHIRAHAGIDIGGTLIGMHLREVAVPVRVSIDKIGKANLILARTRPKYIGGSRTVYE